MKITVTAPRDTHLASLEKAASFQHGGTWRVVDDAHGCWKDPENDQNLCWILERRDQ